MIARTGSDRRVLMLGTFAMSPKGTMSARAAGIASSLEEFGWRARIVTTPWDNTTDAGLRTTFNGVEVVNTRAVSPWHWPRSVREMVAEAKSFRPHVVHLFKPKGFGDIAARFLRRAGYSVVVDMDDWEGFGGWNDVLPYSRLHRSVFDWQERTWPSRASAVTTASRTLSQRAIELGAPPCDVLYFPNRLTHQRFDQLSSIPDEPPQSSSTLGSQFTRDILVYTRFVEFDPEFLVEVIARSIRSCPDARLVIAGSSPDGVAEQRVKRAARRAGVADHIVNIGWIDRANIGQVARHCAAALVPFEDTLINRAKCSVKLLELIACGVPIVASNVGENREYLSRLGGGVLARPGDANDHAAHLLSLVETRGALPTSPRSGRIDLRAACCWHGSISELKQCYESLAACS